MHTAPSPPETHHIHTSYCNEIYTTTHIHKLRSDALFEFACCFSMVYTMSNYTAGARKRKINRFHVRTIPHVNSSHTQTHKLLQLMSNIGGRSFDDALMPVDSTNAIRVRQKPNGSGTRNHTVSANILYSHPCPIETVFDSSRRVRRTESGHYVMLWPFNLTTKKRNTAGNGTYRIESAPLRRPQTETFLDCTNQSFSTRSLRLLSSTSLQEELTQAINSSPNLERPECPADALTRSDTAARRCPRTIRALVSGASERESRAVGTPST